MKEYTPCAIVRWEYDRNPELWVGDEEPSCADAILMLSYFLEQEDPIPVLLWVDADGRPEWLACCVDRNGRQSARTPDVIEGLRDAAETWGFYGDDCEAEDEP